MVSGRDYRRAFKLHRIQGLALRWPPFLLAGEGVRALIAPLGWVTTGRAPAVARHNSTGGARSDAELQADHTMRMPAVEGGSRIIDTKPESKLSAGVLYRCWSFERFPSGVWVASAGQRFDLSGRCALNHAL